jgi:nucleotide-binding universal stress UspA family protein
MRILIAYEGSAHSDAAVDDLPRAGLPDDAKALVVCSSESPECPHAKSAATRLERTFPGWTVRAETAGGSVKTTLVEKAHEWQADLIVMGCRGRAASSPLGLDSVSQYVLHHSHRSIRIGRRSANPPDQPPRLIVGVGGAQPSRAAVKEIARRHWPRGTSARIVGAIDVMLTQAGGTHQLEYDHVRDVITASVSEATESLREAGLSVSIEVRDALPMELILSQADEIGADCIFLGSRNLGYVSRVLIGSTSTTVSASAKCSVEVVHS